MESSRFREGFQSPQKKFEENQLSPRPNSGMACRSHMSYSSRVMDCLSSHMCSFTNSIASAVYGLGELLVYDIKEVGSFLVICLLPHNIQIRFIEQWQTLLLDIEAPLEYKQIELRRKNRMRSFVRLVGSLMPLPPLKVPYLRVVTLSSQCSSSDSLDDQSIHSAAATSRSRRRHHRVTQLVDGIRQFSRSSYESGFSTANYVDTCTSSPESSEELAEQEDEVGSIQSLHCSLQADPIKSSKSKKKRDHQRRWHRTPLNSTENSVAVARTNNLESTLPFSDPAAMEKIKDLEEQLEKLKSTISMIMSQSIALGQPSAIPPPPPPPTPACRPPPPPPPLPPKLLSAANKSVTECKATSLQEMVANKQVSLAKTVVTDKPKAEPDSWSSVINAIKGGGHKLRKVQLKSPGHRKRLPPCSPGDAYRKALAATLKQRFQGLHGSSDVESETDEYGSDASVSKKENQWDSDDWQASPLKSKNSSGLQIIIHKDRLKKVSPLPREVLKDNANEVLAAASEELQNKTMLYLNPVTRDISCSESLVLNTPDILEEQDQVPDSNELFRKFLESDRCKALKKRPVCTRSMSAPAISPLVGDSVDGACETTTQETFSAEGTSTPLAQTPMQVLKPRALTYEKTEGNAAVPPFGPHLLKKRVLSFDSSQSSGKSSNGSDVSTSESTGNSSLDLQGSKLMKPLDTDTLRHKTASVPTPDHLNNGSSSDVQTPS